MIFDEDDLCDRLMEGNPIWEVDNIVVDPSFSLEKMISSSEDPGSLLTWTFPADDIQSIPEFDHKRQEHWFMPEEYKNMDIAGHVLGLCDTQEQLQRAGEELILYQEKNLFDLLKYLKYLVDTMRENQIIWGVGRGSSVASYVLYLLGVHKVDSMFYDLDVREFLR